MARLARHVVRLEAGRVVAAGAPGEVLGPTSVASADERFDAVSIITAPVGRYLADYAVTLLAHPAGDIVVPGRIEAAGPVRIAIRATGVTLATGRSARSACAPC